MFGVTTSDDYRPVGWMGRFPVDVTTILVALHIAAAILAALLFFANAAGVLSYLTLDNAYVLGAGQIWRLATYAFVHSPANLLWFAIEMYMLFAFGREVERFIGRRKFITLYVLLLLVPALVLTALGWWMRLGVSGSASLHFGIFLGFAAIYPNVEMFLLRIATKWIAMILVAIGTLAAMAGHDWGSLLVLWSTAAVALAFLYAVGIRGEVDWIENLKERLRPRLKFKVVPRQRRTCFVPTENSAAASIDPILDKIAKSGIASLTEAERRALDEERARLLKSSD